MLKREKSILFPVEKVSIMNNFDTIAIYTRVSLEDQDLKTNDLKNESNSLTNQKKLLHSYIESHHELVGKQIMEYSDDGFTGRNFERPSFNRMMEEVKTGRIHCVITKDCSRFGRDYIEVGDYIEHIFPFLGVRFIAVNDGYDSARSDGSTPGLDFAFKNLVYDLYSKDLSQKVTSGIQARMKKGQYISGFGLYGYKKSGDRKVPLIIDELAAAVVSNIFQLAIDGNSSQTIARILNQEKVMTPAMYRKGQGTLDFWYPKGKTPLWSTAAVVRILRDERFTGNMVYYKRVKSKVSTNSSMVNPEENRIRVENTHEAIISEDSFKKANDSLRKQEARVDASRKKMSVFYCPHCGHRLRESRGKIKHYYCYSARMYATEECNNVIIDKVYIEGLALEIIRNNGKHLFESQKRSKSGKANNLAVEMKELQLLEKRVKFLEQDNIHLYKEFRDGKYTKEEFVDAKNDRMQEIQRLSEKIEQLCEKQMVDNKSIKELNEAASMLAPYRDIKEYDKNAIARIVKKVVVHAVDRVEVVWAFGDEYF